MAANHLDFDPNQLSQEGLNLLNQGEFKRSLEIFNKLNTHFPNNPDLLNLIAFANLQLEVFDEALSAYNSSININPHQVGALFNRAIVNEKLGKKKEALKDYEAALKFDPNNLDIYQNKAAIYEDLGQYDEALENINHVIKNSPNNYEALANRGNINQNKFDYINSKKDYLKALEINPNNENLLINLGNVQKQLQDYQGAEETFKQALQLNNNSRDAHFNFSLLLLYLKRFKEGWSEYEFRKTKNNIPEAIKNKTEITHINSTDKIIIWPEQGVGDQILFSSMLNDLPKKNSITVALDKRLLKIYRRSFDFLEFISLDELTNQKIKDFKYHIPLGSLGKFYRSNINQFKKQKVSFLNPDKNKVKEIKNFFSKNNMKICGISWKSKNEKIGHAKSLNLIDMRELFLKNELCFLDLQYGDTQKEKDELFQKYNVLIESYPGIDKFDDLDGLLALIEVCDFVVTSSNITAHLAGSIGKKTYLLIPHGLGKLWYWHDDNKSIWYPNIEIIEQKSNENWIDSVNEICKLLTFKK